MKFLLIPIVLLGFAFTSYLMGEERVLFRDPSDAGRPQVSESTWIRFGGKAQGALLKEEEGLIWKTKEQSLILNQFPATAIATVGNRLALKCRMRFYQATHMRYGFQLGIFNSRSEVLSGENPESVVNRAFTAYTGYLAVFSLGHAENQGTILYRRQASPETPDANQLFSKNSRNVTFLAATHGYNAQEEEEMEFLITLERTGQGLRVETSVNGLSISHTDVAPVESFDTVAMLSLGGSAEEISILECEVTISEAL